MAESPELPPVIFSEVYPGGVVVHVRTMKRSDILACPFSILVPAHYRDDGSCKCDNADERRMMIRKWGYSKRDFAKIPLRLGYHCVRCGGDIAQFRGKTYCQECALVL